MKKSFILIGDITYKKINRCINKIERDQNINNIILSTNGGCVDSAFILGEYLRSLDERRIDISVLGHCYSAGTIILMSNVNGMRYMSENSMLMFHRPRFSEIHDKHTTTNDLNNLIKDLKYSEDRMKRCYNKIVDPTMILKDHDLYMDAKRALNLGIIHEII